MLSARQQHCLKGIGITQWQTRPSAEDAADGLAELEQTDTVATPAPIEQPPTQDVVAPAAATTENKAYNVDDWPQTLQAIEACRNCSLAESCTRKVPGKGFQQADLMIVGEAPGRDEDIQGLPFVGRAGKLLDKMLQAIDLDLDKVYITNILKCRPPNNRDPRPEEVQACSQFLKAQIALVQPKVMLSVGRISAQNLLREQSPLGRLRTRQHTLPDTRIPLLVTYHPAYLLRNPADKSKVWDDLKNLQRILQHATD